MSSWEGLTPPYSTIVADPPWAYDEGWPKYHDRAGVPHDRIALPYSSMSVEDIAAMPVYELISTNAAAHLYLWTTNRYLWDARDIALGWGFTATQVLVWCKPAQGLGPGGLYTNATEFVVFGHRSEKTEKRVVERAGMLIRAAREAAGLGRSELHRLVRGGKPTGIVYRWEDDSCSPNQRDWERLQAALPALRDVELPKVAPPPPRDPRQLPKIDRNWWEWPRGPHSAKPPAFLDVVERVSPGPYVELFARAPRLGWDSWGLGYEGAA